jgi:hypothetical protein
MTRGRRFDLRALSHRLNRQLWRRSCAAYGQAVLRRSEQLEPFPSKRGVDDDGRLVLPHDDAVVEAVDAVIAEGGMAALLLVPLLTNAVLVRRELDGRAPVRFAQRGSLHRRFYEEALGTEAPEMLSSLARAVGRAADGEVSSEHLHPAIWWADCATGLGPESASFIVADALLDLSVHAAERAARGATEPAEVTRLLFGSGRLPGVNYVEEIAPWRLVSGFLVNVSSGWIDMAEAHYVGDLVHYLDRNVEVAQEVLRFGTALAMESFELARERPDVRGLVVAAAAGSEEPVAEIRNEVSLYDEGVEDYDLSTLVATCWRCAAEGRLADASDVAGLITREGFATYDLTRAPKDIQVGPLLSSLATLVVWYGNETERTTPAVLAELSQVLERGHLR